jgi:mono/diheme cytochrome c family protein
MKTRLLIVFLITSANATVQADTVPAANDYEKIVKPFFAAHCNKCHGATKPKGDLRLDNLPIDFVTPTIATHWTDVMDRMNAGAMPPAGSPRPSAKETAAVVEWIAAKFAETESLRLAKREKVSFYRLSREEYANTIRDLLGVNFDPKDPTGLAEDDEWRGFERIGSVLTLAPSHIEKYYTAAEIILAEAFPAKAPEKFEQIRPALKMRNGPRDWARLEQEGKADKVRVELWPGHAVQHGRAGIGRLASPGDYSFRLQLSGVAPPGGRAPRLVVYAKELDRVLFEKEILTPEDEPIVVEFQAHLPAGAHTLSISNQVPGPSLLPRSGRDAQGQFFFTTKDKRAPWQMKLTDEQGQPLWSFLIVDWFEVRGPLGAGGPTFAQKEFLPKNPDDLRPALTRFVERAYRRPARSQEIERLTKLIDAETASGEKLENALKTAMLAVLCSKDFLYLVEGSAESNRMDVANAKRKRETEINDWELASRLSYFLWSTMPDEHLLKAAGEGKLRGQVPLHVKRLLADEKAQRFAESFSWQWLQLRNVGKFQPDKLLYPTYDTHLEKSMLNETKAFFHEVLAKNLSLREFLDSDWTMLNGRLAEHYGIAGITGDEFRRVQLDPTHHRGGLLTQAAILSLTSDGQRHRPVHRGKWVLETVFAKSPPPPPPNVEPIEPTPSDQPKATVRMKLAAHMKNPNCAAFHSKFDPLGLAFDNFDAIGRWRTEEVVSDGQGANPKVDASGEFADGRKFADVVEFKKLLVADLDAFGAAFVEKLAIYALRRPMTIDDRPHLAKIAAQAKTADYRLVDTIEALVISELFRRR